MTINQKSAVKVYEGRWATKPEKVKEGILFSYYSPYAREVYISGDFNGWKQGATPLIKGNDDVWRLIMTLPSGRWYDYKFIVDGKWITDPNNPDLNPDTAGDANSVIYLGKSGELLAGDDPGRHVFSPEGRNIRRGRFESPKYSRSFEFFYILPEGQDKSNLPVIICLNNYIKSQRIHEYCKKYGYIGIMPSPELGRDYLRLGKVDTFSELLDYLKNSFKIDDDRIYVTGMSNGGLEAMLVSMYYPDLIAASGLVFGPYRLRYYKKRIKDMNPPELRNFINSLDFPEKMIANLENLPLYISHGGDDEAVPVDDAIVLHEMTEKLGGPAKFKYYPEEGHTWLMVDKDLPEIFDWFGRHTRVRFPKYIHYTAPSGIFKNTIYWAEFTAADIRGPVKVFVEPAGKYILKVEIENISKLILKPLREFVKISDKLKIETNIEASNIDFDKVANEAVITFGC
ncbi:MAG: prolyl oligopeptidase family serine peptidase [Deltaproteobacteria bacterium]